MPPIFRLVANWLAAFSLLLNGLLPFAAEAAAPAQAAMPICSAAPHAKADMPGQVAGPSCDRCCTGAPMPALAGKSGFPAPHDAWTAERTPIFSVAVRAYASRPQAQPRAPPAFLAAPGAG